MKYFLKRSPKCSLDTLSWLAAVGWELARPRGTTCECENPVDETPWILRWRRRLI